MWHGHSLSRFNTLLYLSGRSSSLLRLLLHLLVLFAERPFVVALPLRLPDTYPPLHLSTFASSSIVSTTLLVLLREIQPNFSLKTELFFDLSLSFGLLSLTLFINRTTRRTNRPSLRTEWNDRILSGEAL